MIQVLKASGEKEAFSEEKARHSLQKAGVNQKVQEKLLQKLSESLYEGMTTKKIYHRLFTWLNEEKPFLGTRYGLKQAIYRLGPSGYPFEHFFAKLLAKKGYRTQVGQILSGRCTTHEVDIIAEKADQRFLVECKFHRKQGPKTDIKEALYTYARFLDLKEKQHFDQGWLVTNTKMTNQATDYCHCAGLNPISWDQGQPHNLSALVDQAHLHPITILTSVNQQEKEKLLNEGYVLCSDLAAGSPAWSLILPSKHQLVKQEIALICPGPTHG